MIEFHYSYYFFALSYVLCGYYVNLIAITSLLLVHEFGHFIVAKILGFEVKKVVIYPFGGVTRICGLVNTDIDKEILVAVSGVIFQFCFYLFILWLNKIGLLRDYVGSIFRIYNSQIIFFNLLPIYPLDGAKIFNLLFSKVFCYNTANWVSVVVSVVVMGGYVFVNSYVHNYSYFMIVGVLVIYNFRFVREIRHLYNKFLVERYLYNIRYDKVKIIRSHMKMYKNKSHIFKINNKYMDEEKYLKYYFN